MKCDEFDDATLHRLDDELTRAFEGMSAPPRLRASVMNRIRMPAPTRLPELLDAIGLMGVLSFAGCFAFFVILK